MIRIVIADDHTIMREGLKRILDGAEDVEVVGEAVDGFEALAQVRRGGFDLLLLDLSMPGRSGVDLIHQIKDEAPKLAVLILTMHEEEQYAVRAIRAGAQGYVTKESAGTQLVSAIRKVASGRPYISMEVAEQLALNIMLPHEKLLHEQLSDREFEVFSMLVGGKSITDIADALHLSVKTVSTHKTRIMLKDGHELLVRHGAVRRGPSSARAVPGVDEKKYCVQFTHRCAIIFISPRANDCGLPPSPLSALQP
jgi:DNA-binding NarL/FixJ family response regulator